LGCLVLLPNDAQYFRVKNVIPIVSTVLPILTILGAVPSPILCMCLNVGIYSQVSP
jgi:hypothetical protein